MMQSHSVSRTWVTLCFLCLVLAHQAAIGQQTQHQRHGRLRRRSLQVTAGICAGQADVTACRLTSGCYWDATGLACVQRTTAIVKDCTRKTTKNKCRKLHRCFWDKSSTNGNGGGTCIERPDAPAPAPCANQTAVDACRLAHGCFWDKDGSQCVGRDSALVNSCVGKHKRKKCRKTPGCLWDAATKTCGERV